APRVRDEPVTERQPPTLCTPSSSTRAARRRDGVPRERLREPTLQCRRDRPIAEKRLPLHAGVAELAEPSLCCRDDEQLGCVAAAQRVPLSFDPRLAIAVASCGVSRG